MEISVVAVGGLLPTAIFSAKGAGGLSLTPEADAKAILAVLEEQGLKVEAIINTHGHFDHIGANGPSKGCLRCTACIFTGMTSIAYRMPVRNLSLWAGLGRCSPSFADYLLPVMRPWSWRPWRLKPCTHQGTAREHLLKGRNVLFTGDTCLPAL
jgi:hydroxyacylglutathione hydrolase